jgi:CheY-like chemotaxis protein
MDIDFCQWRFSCFCSAGAISLLDITGEKDMINNLEDPLNPSKEATADHHLLVVDDDDIGRMAAELLLQHQGFRVSSVSGGRQALHMLEESRFSAVLLDLQMPEMDGMEVCRRIRRHQDPAVARMPVIGLTATTLREELEMCLEAGMDTVLTKPLDMAKITSTLLEYFETPSTHAESP